MGALHANFLHCEVALLWFSRGQIDHLLQEARRDTAAAARFGTGYAFRLRRRVRPLRGRPGRVLGRGRRGAALVPARWDDVFQWEYPNFRWFVGGQTNIAYNALDRHLTTERRNKAALIWLGEGRHGASLYLRPAGPAA